jgi:hypothetical protein
VTDCIQGIRLPDSSARKVSRLPFKPYVASKTRRGRYWPRGDGGCYFEVRDNDWHIVAIIALDPEQTQRALDPFGNLRARVEAPPKRRPGRPRTVPRPVPAITITPRPCGLGEATAWMRANRLPPAPFYALDGRELGRYVPCGNITVLIWHDQHNDMRFAELSRTDWARAVDNADRLREGVTLALAP